jgi:hypothetical protein
MVDKRAALVFLAIMAVSWLPRGAAAERVVVEAAQFAPLTENPNFRIFSAGEGIEWVPGYETVWIAGISLPSRAKMTNMIVYCLDNVAPNAMVQFLRTKGDGAPPVEIETVVTGGDRDHPGTGYMSNTALAREPRVDSGTYHYYLKMLMPAQPDDVKGILRVTAVEIVYDK